MLEMLANVNLATDLELLATGGRIVVIGNRGSIEINPRAMMLKEATVTGMVLFNATPEEMADIHRGIEKGLSEGTLNPIIDQELPLGAAAQAHRDVMEKPHQGKIVLKVET